MPVNKDIKEDMLPLYYGTNCKAFMHDLLEMEVEWFHNEWVKSFESDKNTLLLAPRCHGKSSMVAGYIIWRIINNPDIRILVVTLNQKLADGIMNTVKGTFEDNEEVKNIFGDYKGSVWSQQEIRVKRRRKTGIAHREKTLRVCGKSAKIVGQHFDLIILDDIIDREECKTPHKRKENIEWYRKEIKPMLLNNGKIIVVGTRWDNNDIYSKFMRYKSFDVQKYQAVINEEILPKAVKHPDKYRDDVKMLWDRKPEDELGFNWDDAYEYIDENGMTAFQEQYQNKITLTEDNPLKEDWIVNAEDAWEDWINDKNKRNVKLKKYMGVDLASKSGSDYFAITVIGVDDTKNIYVLDQFRGHKSMGEQLEIIKELSRKWNPELVAIESNATQRIITDEWKDSTNLPILQVKSSWVNDKWSRMHKLSVKFETGRVFFNPNWVDLRDELIGFPKGHDDCIDSFSFAIQASEEDAPIDWDAYESVISTKKSSDYIGRV